ncbi:Non-canonical non-ribosomal peptide synthetase FUB8 [Mycena sanguinolenta]|uniref:Non-canonical non-ribosomal peptide synthetase FUB8 n=1 Tax=Mycena sanguinolenta TaxID=230812 RepID=A0A8H6X4G2_9AGAR|nr:Non-canonical non-ribosomal peptide synthetase FUB8 [Mycena sanguinolenta]
MLTVPELVARNCENNPTRPFYIYAQPDSEEITTITHLEFGRAGHRAASLIRPKPQDYKDREVVVIIVLADTVLYHAIVTGVMTAGLIPFPISPRNSPAGILQLLRATSCHRVLATCSTLEPLLTELKNHIAEFDPEFTLQIDEVPSLNQVYPYLGGETADCPFQPYPTPAFNATLEDISFYIHSSGSTGLPRAVGQTYRMVKQWLTLPAITEVEADFEHWSPMGAMALPSFHIYGMYEQLLQPISGTCCAVYPPIVTHPNAVPVTPSPDNILEHARKTKCRSLISVPVLLVAWSHSPAAIAFLKTLDNILYSGGPLPQRIGDALVDAGLHLVSGYGGTEFAPVSTMTHYEEDRKEWAWFRFSPLINVRMVPQGDGIFECQFLAWEHHRAMIDNLEDVKGYATSDLCVNHPEKKHLWRLVGRLDDVIMHSSGEKTVPGPMEDIVLASPHVAGAVMFGRERAQAGILIEPSPAHRTDGDADDIKLAELRNVVWPVIEEANKNAPAFSRIFKEMILFTSKDKPLPRAGKGTVLRRAALTLYEPEIEAIYNAVEEQTIYVTDSIGLRHVAWDVPQIQELLLKIAGTLCAGSTISPTEDLFKQGFDSLIATVFRLRVVKALASDSLAKSVDPNLVYSYPTISKLSAYLDGLLRGTVMDSGVSLEVESLITKYSRSGVACAEVSTPDVSSAVVLLTGVVKVYAFNRPSGQTLAERHFNIFNQRGLDTCLLASSKLVLVEGQSDQANLGLNAELYEEVRSSIVLNFCLIFTDTASHMDKIRNSVTLIIHNAWTLDFNSVLSSFEPHLLGTRHLIDLAHSCPSSPRFLFSSSIAAGLRWDGSRGPCPEDILSEPDTAMGGYGQSKYVAEQILANSGLNATCFRIGQVCGAPPKGAWATSDWFPILVKTSMTLGRLPLVSWIHCETVAQAMIDVGFAPIQDTERLPIVLNLVHPQPVSWNFVINSVRDKLKEICCSKLDLTAFPDWCKELQACEVQAADAKENLPGLKLLNFFNRLADSPVLMDGGEFGGIRFSVGKIDRLSPTLRNARKLAEEDVNGWVEYWHGVGFI